MKYKKILVVTDNYRLYKSFQLLLTELNIPNCIFEFCCTSTEIELKDKNFLKIDIRKEYKKLINKYDLIFSLHCKQIFPIELVNSIKCINIHPGFNPFNRGWYPQVFSIINKLPTGVTIHEMNDQIDHGKIIAQKEIKINNWDTSLDVYNKILITEIDLLRDNLPDILNDNYNSVIPASDGNYNTIKDFKKLLEINTNETVKVKDFIDRLRALTHGDFRNAFFYDSETGKKIFISIQLTQGD